MRFALARVRSFASVVWLGCQTFLEQYPLGARWLGTASAVFILSAGHPSKSAGGGPTGEKNRLTMLRIRRGKRGVRFALARMRSSASAAWRQKFFSPAQ